MSKFLNYRIFSTVLTLFQLYPPQNFMFMYFFIDQPAYKIFKTLCSLLISNNIKTTNIKFYVDEIDRWAFCQLVYVITADYYLLMK